MKDDRSSKQVEPDPGYHENEGKRITETNPDGTNEHSNEEQTNETYRHFTHKESMLSNHRNDTQRQTNRQTISHENEKQSKQLNRKTVNKTCYCL